MADIETLLLSDHVRPARSWPSGDFDDGGDYDDYDENLLQHVHCTATIIMVVQS